MKYGVNEIMNRVYVEPINEETEDFQDFKYIVKIITIENNNGNGYASAKIYSNNNIEEIQQGDWKILPIIKMPFDWGGFYTKLEMIDKENNSVVKTLKPDVSWFKKISFVREIQWIFNSIRELDNIKNKKHFDFLNLLEQEKLTLNSLQSHEVKVQDIVPRFAILDEIILSYNKMKEDFDEQQNINLKTEINELMTLINNIRLELID